MFGAGSVLQVLCLHDPLPKTIHLSIVCNAAFDRDSLHSGLSRGLCHCFYKFFLVSRRKTEFGGGAQELNTDLHGGCDSVLVRLFIRLCVCALDANGDCVVDGAINCLDDVPLALSFPNASGPV